MAYSELLKDPRWQKKRLKILERDAWKCTQCFREDETLHVHHLLYYGMPWDVEDRHLVTLCDTCHKDEERLRQKDLRDIIGEIGMTHLQFLILIDHIKFAVQEKGYCEFWTFHYRILREIVMEDEITDYIQFLEDGKAVH